MRGPESRLWRKVKKAWEGHAVRVEASNGEAPPGTPDCVLSIGGKGGWVELKVWPEPISRIQVAWQCDARLKGACALVFCQVKRDLYWVGYAEDYEGYVNLKQKPDIAFCGNLERSLGDIVRKLLS